MRTLKAWILGALLVACGNGEKAARPAGPRTEQEARNLASDAAAALMGNLIEKLTTALSEGPPEHALGVCGDAAQEITARVCEEQGVFMHRTSDRFRNPRNRPDAWEKTWLERARSGGKFPPEGAVEIARLDDGKRELRYVRPLYVNKLCLDCHGPLDALRPEVRKLLAERYPGDRATGYAAGDFRGIVTVRVPLD